MAGINIDFGKTDVCDGIGEKLDALKNQVLSSAGSMKGKGLKNLKSAIGDFIDSTPIGNLSDLGGLNDAIDGFNDQLSEGLSSELLPDVNNVLDCLGVNFPGSLGDLLPFDPSLPNINLPDLGGALEGLLGNVIDNTVGSFLTGAENVLAGLIGGFESLIPTDLIDGVLGLATCVSGECGGPSGVDLDIEAAMNKAGMLISGEIDYDGLGIPTEYKDHFTQIRDAQNTVKGALKGAIFG